MTITLSDYEEMNVEIRRSIRTSTAEDYVLFSDNPDAGGSIASTSDYQSRIGHLIIIYADTELSKKFVSAHLLLEAEWEQDAARRLGEYLDTAVINSIGGGGHEQRATIDLDIYHVDFVDEIVDRIESDEERGFYGVHKQIERTQELISEVPKEVSEVVSEQYEEIEEIVRSDELNEKEKVHEIQQNIRIGLEKGLPTLFYGRESTEER